MIRIIIACALISLAAAAVIPDDSQAQIINYKNENDGSGNYDFSFETSNGITRQETGRLINAGAEDQYVDVQGSFTYLDADGKLVQVNYRANEDGFQVYPNKCDAHMEFAFLCNFGKQRAFILGVEFWNYKRTFLLRQAFDKNNKEGLC